MGLISFTVPGDPVPQGSMTAFPYLETCTKCQPNRPCGQRLCWHGRVARARVAHDDDGKMKAWRDFVAVHGRSGMAAARWPTRPAFTDAEPVVVGVVFELVRPKGHYLPSNALSADGRRYPYPTREHSGDTDKLLRAVGDALTGVLWPSDAQIVLPLPGKRWAPGRPKEGATHIRAGRIGDLREILEFIAGRFIEAPNRNLELFA